MRRREFLAGSAATLLCAAPSDGFVEIEIGGKPVTRFYFGPQWDKPFLYPLRTVSGRIVSRGYPMEPREGEAADHAWHRGIWYGHGLINGADFWREQGRDKTSRLVADSRPRVTVASGAATVATRCGMLTPQDATLGHIDQRFRIEDDGNLRLIDAWISILADAGQWLTFGDTDDGGFAFRLADAFREDRGARLINDSGRKGTKELWGKPAKWVDYSVRVDGSPCGVAILDHPSNFRHPTRWHARGYSLCSANPFGLKSFTGDRSKDGSHTVPAGQRLEFRYRVLIHEGQFEPEDMAKHYAKWASAVNG